jgi:hypothetical protein
MKPDWRNISKCVALWALATVIVVLVVKTTGVDGTAAFLIGLLVGNVTATICTVAWPVWKSETQ